MKSDLLGSECNMQWSSDKEMQCSRLRSEFDKQAFHSTPCSLSPSAISPKVLHPFEMTKHAIQYFVDGIVQVAVCIERSCASGLKFLVDLRADVLEAAKDAPADSGHLRAFSESLRQVHLNILLN